jgi:hypothetical protein
LIERLTGFWKEASLNESPRVNPEWVGATETRAGAEAVASKWAASMIAPEDVMPAVKEWKTEEAVRDLVKHGELHQQQVYEEVQRRRQTGYFDRPSPRFQDLYPRKAAEGGLLVPPGTRVSGDGQILPDPDPEEIQWLRRRLFEDATGEDYDLSDPMFREEVLEIIDLTLADFDLLDTVDPGSIEG